MLDKIELTPQQSAARDEFARWYKAFHEGATSRPFFTIEGYAGTGKSFTVKQIVDSLDLDAEYMTYTGKAALVLRKYSNLPATTIHSRIYRLVKVSDEEFKKLYDARDKTTDAEEREKITNEIKELQEPKFVLNDRAFSDDDEDDWDPDHSKFENKLIVLDECSMVDAELLSDLTIFGIPILALGDPGQLPPVKGEGALFRQPGDARLTEVLRQAKDNPIIEWSMKARLAQPMPMTNLDTFATDHVAKAPHTIISPQQKRELADDHDVIICWKNKTRQQLNQWRRACLGFEGPYPQKGERIMFTKNDRKAGVFNGLWAEVVEVGDLFDKTIQLKVTTEVHPNPIEVTVLRACFDEYTNPKAREVLRPWDYKDTQEADFAYAITCHKAQGSQWEKVMVFEENVLNWPGKEQDRARWLYTAITRAVEKVTMLTGRL